MGGWESLSRLDKLIQIMLERNGFPRKFYNSSCYLALYSSGAISPPPGFPHAHWHGGAGSAPSPCKS